MCHELWWLARTCEGARSQARTPAFFSNRQSSSANLARAYKAEVLGGNHLQNGGVCDEFRNWVASVA